MRVIDAFAALFLVGAGGAFVMGGLALAKASDLEALYWLVVGLSAMRASVQIARPARG
jgi:hypothetical protein